SRPVRRAWVVLRRAVLRVASAVLRRAVLRVASAVLRRAVPRVASVVLRRAAASAALRAACSDAQLTVRSEESRGPRSGSLLFVRLAPHLVALATGNVRTAVPSRPDAVVRA